LTYNGNAKNIKECNDRGVEERIKEGGGGTGEEGSAWSSGRYETTSWRQKRRLREVVAMQQTGILRRNLSWLRRRKIVGASKLVVDFKSSNGRDTITLAYFLNVNQLREC
jgi:hypothetical protein